MTLLRWVLTYYLKCMELGIKQLALEVTSVALPVPMGGTHAAHWQVLQVESEPH
jgi:hypothetical protein